MSAFQACTQIHFLSFKCNRMCKQQRCLSAERIKKGDGNRPPVAVLDKELCNCLKQKSHIQININMNRAVTTTEELKQNLPRGRSDEGQGVARSCTFWICCILCHMQANAQMCTLYFRVTCIARHVAGFPFRILSHRF